ncbi:hypothetical protein GCK32_016768, partial [Trichostrongylus colubriformis]
LQARSPPKPPPPVPPHRQSMYEPQRLIDNISSNEGLMTSSVIEPMTSAFGSAKSSVSKDLEDQLSASIDSVNSWISSFEDLMTTSFQDVMRDSMYSTRSDGSSTVTRDREDSNATTLVASPTDSDGEGTVTPVPFEASQSQPPTSSDRSIFSEATTSSIAVNRSSSNRDATQREEVPEISPRPIPAPRTVLVGRNGERKTTAAPTVLSSTRDHISSTSTGAGSTPTKSIQISAPRSVNDTKDAMRTPMPRKERDVVVGGSLSAVRKRIESKDPLADADSRLSSSIARLSRSVYGELNEEEQAQTKEINRLSIPAMRRYRCSSEKRIDQTGSSSNELERWKKRVRSNFFTSIYSV